MLQQALKAIYSVAVCRLPVRILAMSSHGEKAMRILQGKGGHLGGVKHEVRAVRRFLPARGAVVVDAGANRGQWARALLNIAESQIKCVYAFEPSRILAPQLQALNSSKIEVVNVALSNRTGSATLYASRPGSGSASLKLRDLRHRGRIHGSVRETVDIVTLDEFAAERGIDRIDFLKMDVEGHELSVLHGARGLLKACRIRALAFEFGSANVDARTFFRDYWYLLTEAGFLIWRVVPGGRLLEIERYGSELESFFLSNYVAALTSHSN